MKTNPKYCEGRINELTMLTRWRCAALARGDPRLLADGDFPH